MSAGTVEQRRGGGSRGRTRAYGLRQDERGIWHCDFQVAGKRFQRSSYTTDQTQAEEWCAQLASDVWRERKLGEKPGIRWSQAVADWFRTKQSEGKKDLEGPSTKARLLADHWGDPWLHDLTEDLIERTLDLIERRRDSRGVERIWAAATRTSWRSFVRGVIQASARKYRVPNLRLEAGRPSRERVRWITKEEAARLLAALPLHYRRVARFSLATGLRQGNVCGLRWRQIDMDRRLLVVPASFSKSGKPLTIPLSDEAMAVLIEARDCPELAHDVFVFSTTWGGPFTEPKGQIWQRTLRQVGIEDFHWHDLRHTWATWHVMAGTPLPVLQKLGGWNNIRHVMRYAHVSEDFAAGYANAIGAIPGGGQQSSERRIA